MPDVSKTEIGRRMFQLQKEKAVEKVVEKIRQNTGAGWKTLSEADVHLLERLLQAVWVTIEQVKWTKIRFDRMSVDDVKRVLSIGKSLDLEKLSQRTVSDALEKVLLSVG